MRRSTLAATRSSAGGGTGADGAHTVLQAVCDELREDAGAVGVREKDMALP